MDASYTRMSAGYFDGEVYEPVRDWFFGKVKEPPGVLKTNVTRGDNTLVVEKRWESLTPTTRYTLVHRRKERGPLPLHWMLQAVVTHNQRGADRVMWRHGVQLSNPGEMRALFRCPPGFVKRCVYTGTTVHPNTMRPLRSDVRHIASKTEWDSLMTWITAPCRTTSILVLAEGCLLLQNINTLRSSLLGICEIVTVSENIRKYLNTTREDGIPRQSALIYYPENLPGYISDYVLRPGTRITADASRFTGMVLHILYAASTHLPNVWDAPFFQSFGDLVPSA